MKGSTKLFVNGHINTGSGSCKYLGIILRSDLSWADQVNYTVKKAGRHYISQCEYSKRKIVIPNFSLHVPCTSDS